MEPLRRKLNANIAAQSNTRRIGGGELIKLGQKLTEMPKGGAGNIEEQVVNHNSSLVNNIAHGATSNSIILPSSKSGNAGSIISRAAAAQQILHQKSVLNSHMSSANPNSSRAMNTSGSNYNTQ